MVNTRHHRTSTPRREPRVRKPPFRWAHFFKMAGRLGRGTFLHALIDETINPIRRDMQEIRGALHAARAHLDQLAQRAPLQAAVGRHSDAIVQLQDAVKTLEERLNRLQGHLRDLVGAVRAEIEAMERTFEAKETELRAALDTRLEAMSHALMDEVTRRVSDMLDEARDDPGVIGAAMRNAGSYASDLSRSLDE